MKNNCPVCGKATKISCHACQFCKSLLVSRKGFLFTLDNQDPTQVVLDWWVSIVLPAQGLSFQAGQRTTMFRSELAAAWKLIKMAEGNMPLIKRAFQISIASKDYSWKKRPSLHYYMRDWYPLLTDAKKALASESSHEVAGEAYLEAILG